VLLGNGRSSRPYQQVREIKGVVHHVDAWTYNPGSTGLFGISAVWTATIHSRREAILAEVEGENDRLRRRRSARP
jgi:predicted Zn-dependent peptidase